jgi:hypothetical protein
MSYQILGFDAFLADCEMLTIDIVRQKLIDYYRQHSSSTRREMSMLFEKVADKITEKEGYMKEYVRNIEGIECNLSSVNYEEHISFDKFMSSNCRKSLWNVDLSPINRVISIILCNYQEPRNNLVKPNQKALLANIKIWLLNYATRNLCHDTDYGW